MAPGRSWDSHVSCGLHPLRGEEARKTIEDMHAVWTMENEEAHDERRESESREPSTHCTGR